MSNLPPEEMTARHLNPDFVPRSRYDAVLAENQRLRDALEASERALADAEKIITSYTGPGSWVGSLTLSRVRDALAAVRVEDER